MGVRRDRRRRGVEEGRGGGAADDWGAAEIFGVLCERPSIRHCFSCGSWLAWRNNTKLKSPGPADVVQSYRRARLIFNKNYDQGAGGWCEIKKFTRRPEALDGLVT